MTPALKIKQLKQRIKEYQEKYPIHRTVEQVNYLSCLWLELSAYYLIEKGEARLADKPEPTLTEKVKIS
jgi:hypothetical protein